MSFGSLRALAFGINQAVHGVPATITPHGGSAISTSVIWMVEPQSDPQPYGSDLRRADPRRIAAIAKADVPALERGDVIVAPEVEGETNKTWKVDGVDRSLVDQWRAIVKLQN
jgi:hypothetical protein